MYLCKKMSENIEKGAFFSLNSITYRTMAYSRLFVCRGNDATRASVTSSLLQQKSGLFKLHCNLDRTCRAKYKNFHKFFSNENCQKGCVAILVIFIDFCNFYRFFVLFNFLWFFCQRISQQCTSRFDEVKSVTCKCMFSKKQDWQNKFDEVKRSIEGFTGASACSSSIKNA